MAKKKDKEAGAALLPKVLAGVKVPKALRRQAHHLVDLARSPVVADLLAAGLVALAAKLRNEPASAAAAPEPEPAPAAEATPKPAAKPAKAPRNATPKPATVKKPAAKKPAAEKPAAKKDAAPAAKPRRSTAPSSKTTH